MSLSSKGCTSGTAGVAPDPTCAWISTDTLPNGDVSPWFELVVGNVLRQPFMEAWNSPAFRDHRRRPRPAS
jgi:MoaA/NifB/PqqE/SkfB family radical SAM enzyme